MTRKSEGKDIEAILDIWLAASIISHDFIEPGFWESQVESMRTLYLPASELYVYEQDAHVIGFYTLCENTLAAIFVKPACQVRGYGKALLRHAQTQRNGLNLTVYKANEASCHFYLAHGFVITGEQTDAYTGHMELLMSTGSE
ncbi:GNAT family N-acetyltransferase [Zobellella maritima]|uniref:GNAT family N-acetyltransferase n=1 Tax=Zobellella maritima TaxID=2059725 RepID=UPI0018E4EA95|nr:GNAT family N-acetyltransferase [Zobellella maritima]